LAASESLVSSTHTLPCRQREQVSKTSNTKVTMSTARVLMVIVTVFRAVKAVSNISNEKGVTFTIESLAFIARTPLHYEVLSEAFSTH
jgi:hypothetical protein